MSQVRPIYKDEKSQYYNLSSIITDNNNYYNNTLRYTKTVQNNAKENNITSEEYTVY